MVGCSVGYGTTYQSNCTADNSYNDDEDRHGCDLAEEADVL